MDRHKTHLQVEELESRCLMSGMTGGPSVAVLVDLAKIQMDQQTLLNDLQTLGPTLYKDQQALQMAIQSASQSDPTVQAAVATLKMDNLIWQSILEADLAVVLAATTPATRMATFAHLKADFTAAVQSLQIDQANVQVAIQNNAGVEAAQAQLTADSAPITADATVLQADAVQLQKDLKAQAG